MKRTLILQLQMRTCWRWLRLLNLQILALASNGENIQPALLAGFNHTRGNFAVGVYDDSLSGLK